MRLELTLSTTEGLLLRKRTERSTVDGEDFSYQDSDEQGVVNDLRKLSGIKKALLNRPMKMFLKYTLNNIMQASIIFAWLSCPYFL